MSRATVLFFFAILQLCLGFAPTFLWSNQQVFSGHNEQILNNVAFADIESKIFGIAKTQNPEIILAFVHPKMSVTSFTLMVDYDSYAPLKNLMDSSTTSFIAQYTETPKFATQLGHDFSTQGGSVYLASETGKTDGSHMGAKEVMTISALEEKLKSGSWEVLNNKKTDLIVVLFHVEDQPEVIAQQTQLMATIVDSVKGVSYLGVFGSEEFSTSVNARSEIISQNADAKLARFNKSFRQTQQSVSDTYWPNQIVEALIVIAPFIIIALIGVTCTFGIQSDLKFELAKNDPLARRN